MLFKILSKSTNNCLLPRLAVCNHHCVCVRSCVCLCAWPSHSHKISESNSLRYAFVRGCPQSKGKINWLYRRHFTSIVAIWSWLCRCAFMAGLAPFLWLPPCSLLQHLVTLFSPIGQCKLCDNNKLAAMCAAWNEVRTDDWAELNWTELSITVWTEPVVHVIWHPQRNPFLLWATLRQMPDGESRESQPKPRDRAGKSEFQFVDSHVRQSWPLFRRLVSRSVGWLVGWLVS